MRKLFLAAATVVFFFLSSCNNNKTNAPAANPQSQKNIEAARVILDVFKTGEVNRLDNVVSPDYVDHRPEGDIKGIDSLKKSVLWVRENMKDMKSEVTREWADEEYVALWMQYSGNNAVAMAGMPAGPYNWNIIELTRYKDGKAIEHWAFTEAQTVARMMEGTDTSAAQ